MRPANVRLGFTMIEILVVVAIMAIVLGIGIPSMFRVITKTPMAQAVSAFVEGCDKARGAAILDGVPSELIIDVEDGRLILSVRTAPQWTHTGSEGEEGLVGGSKTLAGSGGFRTALSEDVVLRELFINQRDYLDASTTQTDDARIRFFPNGVCDEMNVLISLGSEFQKIMLDPVTGGTDVEKVKD